MKKLLFLFVLLASCSSSVSPEPSYSTIKNEYSYEDVSNIIEFEETFLQEDKQYLVYFYSTTCGHCEAIKQDIIAFYKSNKESIYFVNCTNKNVYGNKKDLTGVSAIDDFYIFGTPFLISIIERCINEYYYGVSQIREYIAYKNSLNQIE